MKNNESPIPIKVNQRRLIHTGRVFDFTVENVTFSDDLTLDLEVIRHPGASAVVALTDDRHVLMLRQYRHAVGGYIWEIPAGTFNGREEPLACARRELIEETGYQADSWEPMGAVTPLAGYSDERIYLYLARDLAPAEQNLDPDEILEVHRVPIGRVSRMIADGKIEDAKTIAALFRTLDRINNGNLLHA
jgi:ADP-ribose pyrophosphatase